MSRVIRKDAETVTISVEEYDLLIAKSNTLYAYTGGEYKLCTSFVQAANGICLYVVTLAMVVVTILLIKNDLNLIRV